MTQAKIPISNEQGLFFKSLSQRTKPNIFVLNEENSNR